MNYIKIELGQPTPDDNKITDFTTADQWLSNNLKTVISGNGNSVTNNAAAQADQDASSHNNVINTPQESHRKHSCSHC